MWIDKIPSDKSWTILWSGLVLCSCDGIRSGDGVCPVCDGPPDEPSPKLVTLENGESIEVYKFLRGAEGRYEDYQYLQMMEREWKRTSEQHLQHLQGTSDKASLVLLFWTYFESRIERILRLGLGGVPEALAEDTLDRYSSIGARLGHFYRVLFGTTYEKDLMGLGHGKLWTHLKEVQIRRNEFMHGNPAAIDDNLVRQVVENLQIEHEAWILVFNKRLRTQREQQVGQ